jgi:hypothetical protein
LLCKVCTILAEANGLSGTEELKAGQVLVVPSNGKSELINSQTHKTYNEKGISRPHLS